MPVSPVGPRAVRLGLDWKCDPLGRTTQLWTRRTADTSPRSNAVQALRGGRKKPNSTGVNWADAPPQARRSTADRRVPALATPLAERFRGRDRDQLRTKDWNRARR